MKVLVTGATGFVGSQLSAELVRRGHPVRVLRRASSKTLMLEGLPVEHVIGDILEPDDVQRAVEGCDIVFHTAAVSSYWRARRPEIYRTNVEGTRIVMEACLRAGVRRVVHTSSAAAVGFRNDGVPADEENPFDRLSAGMVYADSKHRAEAEVQNAVQRGLDAVIVNPVVIIGPGDHYLVSSSMVLEYARRSLPFAPPGGMCVADIDAVVRGHLAAMERGRRGERYILGGENLSYAEVSRVIREVAGRKPPRYILPRWVLGPAAAVVDLYNRINPRPPIVSGEQIRLSAIQAFFDASKAIRELDYSILPFRRAAERAYRWYKDHGYLD